MTIKTNVKAGGIGFNHNESLAVRSNVKAGLSMGRTAHSTQTRARCGGPIRPAAERQTTSAGQ
jgi:hypothetical protein